MAAFVHINLRIINAERQSRIGPRFLEALSDAGGRVVHFGPVVQRLEGDVEPLELAGIFEFPSVDEALSFYNSPDYLPIKAERQLAQEARMFVVDASR